MKRSDLERVDTYITSWCLSFHMAEINDQPRIYRGTRESILALLCDGQP